MKEADEEHEDGIRTLVDDASNIERQLEAMSMKIGIQLTVDCYDEDVVRLTVAASNGRFSGLANVFAPLDFAKELATAVQPRDRARG